jgi:hypothetical protein
MERCGAGITGQVIASGWQYDDQRWVCKDPLVNMLFHNALNRF